jgi:hypothetical protein
MPGSASERGGGARESSPRVIVIGAGVSGCACAATLAGRGVAVMLLTEALDSVGQPRLGPVVAGRGGGAEIAHVWRELPGALRGAWVGAAMAPAEATFVIVDRRMVSVETKRFLEGMRGLEFRQGMACDIAVCTAEVTSGPQQRGRVVVKTVFGESLEAEGVVVAVGASMGMGEQRDEEEEGGKSGGRWDVGEAGLKSALQRLGAVFGETCVAVGPRVKLWRDEWIDAGQVGGGASVGSGGMDGRVVRRARLHRVSERSLSIWAGEVSEGSGGEGPDETAGRWHVEWPESPHGKDEFWPREALVRWDGRGDARPFVSPDGVVTGEWYVAEERVGDAYGCETGSEEEGNPEGQTVTRIGRVMRALVVTNVDKVGRLCAPGSGQTVAWVTGQAAGAQGYLESLAAGVRTGMSVADALGAGG